MFRSPKLLSSLLLMILSLLLLATGCSRETSPLATDRIAEPVTPLPFFLGDKIGDRGEDGETHAEEIVTRNTGGSVTLRFLTVDVPKKAVDDDTTITIDLYDPDFAAAELGPDGTQFDKEVTLEVDLGYFEDYLSANGIAPEDLVIALYDEDLEQWTALKTNVKYEDDKAMGLKAKTTHFSRYALAD